MPKLTNLPKNTLYFYANDEADFIKWQENWTRNGWLLTSDFRDSMYEAIAFINGIVCCLLYEMPKVVEPTSEPTPPAIVEEKNIMGDPTETNLSG